MLICLATYNGAQWLPAQLESLIAQDDQSWTLLVSDDGSADATQALLRDYQQREARIELLPPRDGRAGPGANFEYLLGHAWRRSGEQGGDRLIALCDQDDVWRSDKLTLNRQALASSLGCCSDLALTRADGQPTGQRLLRQLAAPRPLSTSALLAQNSAVGCTLALHAQVLELALPFPPLLLNHDWWLALCVSVAGELALIDEPLVNYRQHANNSIGAYRPMQQVFKARSLIARQRRVLVAQQQAVRILGERLKARGQSVPEVLPQYLSALGHSSATRRARNMLSGRFAAPHRPLRLLRSVVALTGVAADEPAKGFTGAG